MRKQIALPMAGITAIAIVAGGATAALWATKVDFNSLPFTNATATFTAQAGTGNLASSSRFGNTVSTTFDSSLLTDLKASNGNAVAKVIDINGKTPAKIGIDYSLVNTTTEANSYFFDTRVKMKIIPVSTASQCTSAVVGTAIYDGTPTGGTFSTRTLLNKPVTSGTGTLLDNQKLCAVFIAPVSTSTYSQTATATAIDDSGTQVTSSNTWNSQVAKAYPNTGTLTLNFNWNAIR